MLLVAESPEKVRLVGFVGEEEGIALVDCCHQMRALGRTRLELEMGAVTDVTASALRGLNDLVAGSSGLDITIRGARWGQFMALLADVPISALQSTCDAIRGIVTTATPPPLGTRNEAAVVPEPRGPDEREALET